MREPTVGVKKGDYPQRHLKVYNLKTGEIFELFFDDDYECEKFINKCRRGNKLVVILDVCDIGYD